MNSSDLTRLKKQEKITFTVALYYLVRLNIFFFFQSSTISIPASKK